MKKRLITLALAMLMLITLVTPVAAARTHNFTDVRPEAWYNAAVQFVFENSIMSGIGGNRFDPQGTFTRGAAVTTLARIQWGRPAIPSDSRVNPFTDVASTAWYAPYVTWARNMGIVSGTSATTFAPGRSVTRQEIVEMLFNFAMFRGDHRETPAGAINGFSDAYLVAGWARDSMNWAVGYGIMSGRGNNTLAPTGTLTRAEAAQLLMNFIAQEGGGNNNSGGNNPNPGTTLEEEVRAGAAYWQLQGRFSSADIRHAFEQEVLRLVNVERAAHGLSTVQWSTALGNAAREHSIDMVTNNFFGHLGSDGRGSIWRAMDAGWDGQVRENISSFDNPARMMEGVMASPGHRANVLDPSRTHLGVGFARSASGEYRWSQKFGAPW